MNTLGDLIAMDFLPTRTLLIFFLSMAVKSTYCGNILIPSIQPFSTPSHQMVVSTVTKGLVQNGHNVTLLTTEIQGTDRYPNGSYSQVLFFSAAVNMSEIEELMEYIQATAFKPESLAGRFRLVATMFTSQKSICMELLRDESIIFALRRSQFDLMIVFPFSPCDVILAHHLRLPFVVFLPTLRLPLFHEGYYGMPYPSSYVPFDVFSLETDAMSLLQRTKNLLEPFKADVMGYVISWLYSDVQRTFDIQPRKTVTELYADASLILCHVSEGSDFPRPRTPNFIPIGGVLAHPPEPLPQELEDFIEGAGDNGVVIFTLGSAIKGVKESQLFETFARVFSKLPQRILWRHSGELPRDIGENTKIVEWLPQNDILGHPKARLLIYHGGSNGVGEAIYHGVPMVIIPMFGDQFAHAARVQKKGMGLMLDKTNITEEGLMEVIQEVLHNPRYKERSLHFSRIHRDAPMTPLQRSIYWIEHVMKFGADHLRPRSAHIGVIELYMIDVTLFLILVCLIGLYIVYVILKLVYGCCCKKKPVVRKQTKSKGE